MGSMPASSTGRLFPWMTVEGQNGLGYVGLIGLASGEQEAEVCLLQYP